MITKEALEMYTKDIDRDLSKLDADYKDYEKKLEGYNVRIEEDNLDEEVRKQKDRREKFKAQVRLNLLEYKNIVKELANKRDMLNNETEKEQPKILQIEKLEEKLVPINEEMKIIKEELKQTNPNYTKVQERIKDTNKTKIPELITIPS